MRTLKTLVIAALVLSISGLAVAELQNVEVGGKLQIRGNYFNMDAFDSAFTEQRTQLNIKADFTNDVSAFIELDSYDIWGEDFRSNYLTGADGRAVSNNDVEMYQAYVQVKNLYGLPLTSRTGRQELVFGSEFVLGNNNSGAFFTGLSYDATRWTYATDTFSVDAFAGKLAETFGDFAKDDIDLVGVYGSYLGIEDVAIDAYWLYVNDDKVMIGDKVKFHTVGLRGAGALGAFDFDVEAAYQFGDVDNQPSACPFGFGEADVNYKAWAGNLVAGYTFDMAWQPRVFVMGAYFGGADYDESHCSNDRDLAFNRLFSDVEYSEFLDNASANISNFWVAGLGVQVMPTEAVSLKLVGKYFSTVEDVLVYDGFLFDHDTVGGDLGWEVGLYGDYHYSEDLTISAGYAHFFGDDGLECGFIANNGLTQINGDENDDYDYVFVQTEIAF